MTESELREAYAAFRARGTDASVLDAAWLVAACERSRVPQREALSRQLDVLAEEARPYLGQSSLLRGHAEGLCVFLKDVCGFAGNPDQYYTVDNSYLDCVLSTRRGIPITLAVVYLEVAGRLGLAAEGINFPGHFLVRLTDGEQAGAEPLLLDPFAGRVLTLFDCAELLRQSQGPDAQLESQHMAAANGRQILIRMLNNLKQLALNESQWSLAVRWSERIQLVEPDLVMEHRDRALVYERMDEPASAVAEWYSLVEALRDAELKSKVEARIAALEGRLDSGRVVH